MPSISLYWFAEQQQTSTLTTQNWGYFYREFNAESKELGFFFSEKKCKWPKIRSNELSR